MAKLGDKINQSNNAVDAKPRAQTAADEGKPSARGGKNDKKQYAKKQPQNPNAAQTAKQSDNSATFVDSAIIAQPAQANKQKGGERTLQKVSFLKKTPQTDALQSLEELESSAAGKQRFN